MKLAIKVLRKEILDLKILILQEKNNYRMSRIEESRRRSKANIAKYLIEISQLKQAIKILREVK